MQPNGPSAVAAWERTAWWGRLDPDQQDFARMLANWETFTANPIALDNLGAIFSDPRRFTAMFETRPPDNDSRPEMEVFEALISHPRCLALLQNVAVGTPAQRGMLLDMVYLAGGQTGNRPQLIDFLAEPDAGSRVLETVPGLERGSGRPGLAAMLAHPRRAELLTGLGQLAPGERGGVLQVVSDPSFRVPARMDRCADLLREPGTAAALATVCGKLRGENLKRYADRFGRSSDSTTELLGVRPDVYAALGAEASRQLAGTLVQTQRSRATVAYGRALAAGFNASPSPRQTYDDVQKALYTAGEAHEGLDTAHGPRLRAILGRLAERKAANPDLPEPFAVLAALASALSTGPRANHERLLGVMSLAMNAEATRAMNPTPGGEAAFDRVAEILAGDPETRDSFLSAATSWRTKEDVMDLFVTVGSPPSESRRVLAEVARLQTFLTYASSPDHLQVRLLDLDQRIAALESTANTGAPAADPQELERLRSQRTIIAKRQEHNAAEGVAPPTYLDAEITCPDEELVEQPDIPPRLTIDEESLRRWFAGQTGNSFTGIVSIDTGAIYLMPVSPGKNYPAEPFPVGGIESPGDLPFRNDPETRYDDYLHSLGDEVLAEPAHQQFTRRLATLGVDPDRCVGFTVSKGDKNAGDKDGAGGVWAFRWRSRSVSGGHFVRESQEDDGLEGVLSTSWANAVKGAMIREVGVSPQRRAMLSIQEQMNASPPTLTREQAQEQLKVQARDSARKRVAEHRRQGAKDHPAQRPTPEKIRPKEAPF